MTQPSTLSITLFAIVQLVCVYSYRFVEYYFSVCRCNHIVNVRVHTELCINTFNLRLDWFFNPKRNVARPDFTSHRT